MEKNLLQGFVLLLAFMSCTLLGYSQEIVTVKQALNFIKTSTPPYRNAKRTLIPAREAFPRGVEGISEKLYEDLQCTKWLYASLNYDDLEASLYLRVDLPNGYTLGALTFGGATDIRNDRIFVANSNGKILSTMDTFVGISDASVKQFQLTADYKVIIYQLVPTSSQPVLFADILENNNTVTECYRLDTTYRIDANGQFVKENETKYPVKRYATWELIEKNVWDL